MSTGCSIWNPLYLDNWFMRRRALNVFSYISLHVCKMKSLLVGSFLGGFHFYAQVYKPCLKDAAYEIPLHLDNWFMRRRALNVFSYISLHVCKMKSLLVGSFCQFKGKVYLRTTDGI